MCPLPLPLDSPGAGIKHKLMRRTAHSKGAYMCSEAHFPCQAQKLSCWPPSIGEDAHREHVGPTWRPSRVHGDWKGGPPRPLYESWSRGPDLEWRKYRNRACDPYHWTARVRGPSTKLCDAQRTARVPLDAVSPISRAKHKNLAAGQHRGGCPQGACGAHMAPQ